MKNINVIVFDHGNTLLMDPFLASLKVVKQKLPQLIENYGLKIKPDTLIKAWAKANKVVNYPNVSHFLQEEPIVSYALDSLKVPHLLIDLLSLDLLKEYRIALKNIVKTNKRNKEVRNTLKELIKRGKKLGVFSDDRRVDLLNNLSLMGILEHFSYVFSSEEIGIEKPNKEVFKHIKNFFDIPEKQIVYIGDNPIRDIEAAKKFGFKAILYKAGNKYQEKWRNYHVKIAYKPDATIEKFSDILKVIE